MGSQRIDRSHSQNFRTYLRSVFSTCQTFQNIDIVHFMSIVMCLQRCKTVQKHTIENA